MISLALHTRGGLLATLSHPPNRLESAVLLTESSQAAV